jgi:hypothetical protein
MDSEKRFNKLVDEALAQSFSGWDFSFVVGRIEEVEPSWNYKDLAKNRISSASALLDMCTGGGEFLDQFQTLPKKTYATEGYSPNVIVAKDRLEPRSVHVVSVESDERLPLADNEFDLIINRHGAYSSNEIARISGPAGAIFLTQQVGSNNANGLNEELSAPVEAASWNLHLATAALIEQGFVITYEREEHPVMSFKDIGAVVFYLKAIPWQIPDFEYSKYRHELLDLHERIELHGSFDVSAHRFLVEASLG